MLRAGVPNTFQACTTATVPRDGNDDQQLAAESPAGPDVRVAPARHPPLIAVVQGAGHGLSTWRVVARAHETGRQQAAAVPDAIGQIQLADLREVGRGRDTGRLRCPDVRSASASSESRGCRAGRTGARARSRR